MVVDTKDTEKGDFAVVDQATESKPTPYHTYTPFILVPAMALIAASGMIYELLIATVSGYILGSDVTHFSLVIGVFLFAMGIGAAISRRYTTNLLDTFLRVELLLGLLGLLTCPVLLYFGFVMGVQKLFLLVVIFFTTCIGVCIGLEIPILSRFLEQYSNTRTTLSNVLAADYVGSLLGALAFPYLLLPKLGLTTTCAIAGLLNIFVVFMVSWFLRRDLLFAKWHLWLAGVLALPLLGLVWVGGTLFHYLELSGYRDNIVHRERSRYQRIILTQGPKKYPTTKKSPTAKKTPRAYLPRRWKDDMRLFLDGNLQFSSIDEYRYHEALVHPAFALHPNAKKVLILGGGDGLAAKQILKYHQAHITLVDLDPRILHLAKNHKKWRKLNQDALRHPRVKTLAGDAFVFVRTTPEQYDIIYLDLPDPHNAILCRFYAVEFYKMLKKRLKPGGLFVTQSTSPYFARRAYWSIGLSIERADLHVLSYHVNVPSFGDWGFHMARKKAMKQKDMTLQVQTRYLNDSLLQSMFVFGKDVAKIKVQANTLSSVKLYGYYQDARWEHY